MTIITAFDLGDIVYLKTDSDQRERMVTAFFVRQGSICYYLACGEGESYHYELEISTDRDWKKT